MPVLGFLFTKLVLLFGLRNKIAQFLKKKRKEKAFLAKKLVSLHLHYPILVT
jgi:hypothetical protein